MESQTGFTEEYLIVKVKFTEVKICKVNSRDNYKILPTQRWAELILSDCPELTVYYIMTINIISLLFSSQASNIFNQIKVLCGHESGHGGDNFGSYQNMFHID